MNLQEHFGDKWFNKKFVAEQIMHSENLLSEFYDLSTADKLSIVAAKPDLLYKLGKAEQETLITQNPVSLLKYANNDLKNKIISQNPELIEYGWADSNDRENGLIAFAKENPSIIIDVAKAQPNLISSFVLHATLAKEPMLISKLLPDQQIQMLRSLKLSKSYSEAFAASSEIAQTEMIRIYPKDFVNASNNVKNNKELHQYLANEDFRNLDMLTPEQRENSALAGQYQKWNSLQDFKAGRTKLNDINKNNFIDINFYNEIVKESKEKVLREFERLTKDLEPNDRLEEKLEKKLAAKLNNLEKKLEIQRKWTMLKNKIGLVKRERDVLREIGNIEV